jgi:hypothetical protein
MNRSQPEIQVHEYYDGDHVWDHSTPIKRLKLQRMKGYLFGSEGVLNQEFEAVFDLNTGKYAGGYERFADGTEHRHGRSTPARTAAGARRSKRPRDKPSK